MSFKRSASREIVVLDLSSLLCKVGFAGEGSPRYILRLGLPQPRSGPVQPPEFEEQIELLLREIFLKRLMCAPHDRKVVICESIVENTTTRNTLLKVLLEKMKVTSVLSVPAPVLSLYASGMDCDVSGLVLQVGYAETTALPICNRLPLLHAMSIARHGTKAVHDCILHLAKEEKLVKWGGVGGRMERLAKCSPHAEDLDDIIMRACFVQATSGSSTVSSEQPARSITAEKKLLVASGVSVWMSGEARAGVCDVLFGGGCGSVAGDSELSVARMLLDALMVCAIDVRPKVARRVVLAGGGVMIPGFQARLLEECKRICAEENRYTELSALVSSALDIKPTPFQPNTLPWVGGSIFATASKLEGAITLAAFKDGKGAPDPLFTSPAASSLFVPPLPSGVDLSWLQTNPAS